MDTKYPANSLHNGRSFRGTFSIQINTVLQCVSLGNVDPACIWNREKTCPGNPASQTAPETNSIKRGSFPADVFSGTHTAGQTAGYLRTQTAF